MPFLFELAVGAAFLLLLLYIYMTWNHRYWHNRGIATDKPSPFFGSVAGSVLMMRNRAEDIDDIYRRHPGEKVVGWYNIRSPCLLVRDPEIVQKVMVTDFNYFRNNNVKFDVPDDPLSKNLFVLKDDEWKKSRALITPAFTSGKIKAIYPQMMEVGKEFAEYLRRHPEELHIKDTMSRYTTEIIAKCAFGIEGNAFKEENSPLHQIGRQVFNPDKRHQLVSILIFIAPQLNRLLKLSFVPDGFTKFFKSLLDDVIVYRQEKDVKRNDLVQYLIDLKRKSLEVEKGTVQSENITKAYTNDDILAGCVTFFIEAYETTALAITHVLYNLAWNKDVQEKLRREIDETLKEGELTYERIHEMKYLNCVIQESNRITPVSHFMFKECVETYNMDLGDGKVLHIEKGMPITIPQYGLHTDGKYWEEPEKYKPERFAHREEKKSVFMPFGDGPRMCIGVRIATTVMKVALVHILSELEVLTSSKTPKTMKFDPQYLLTSHKGGIHLKFAERSR